MEKQSSDWTIIQDGGWNRTGLNKMKFSDWPKFKFKFSLMQDNCFDVLWQSIVMQFITTSKFNCLQLKAYKGYLWLKAIKLQSCSIHHLELLSNQMTAFPFAILNSYPITGWVAILNYFPIRRLLSICHLAFLTNQRWAAPPHPPPGIELSLLHYFSQFSVLA